MPISHPLLLGLLKPSATGRICRGGNGGCGIKGVKGYRIGCAPAALDRI